MDGNETERHSILDLEVARDLRLAMAEQRIELVEPDAATRDAARVMIAGSAWPRLVEENVWQQWKNVVVGISADLFQDVTKDKDQSYLEWLARRLENPFAIDSYAHFRLVRRYDAEFVHAFTFGIWKCEEAWARRLRRSSKDLVSVYSRMFLDQVARDPWTQMKAVCDAYAAAATDPSYILSEERHYDPVEIRAGYGSDTFRPAFLRHAEAAFFLRVQKLDGARVSVMAEAARKEEEEELTVLAARRAAAAARRISLSHTPGVMAVALECRMTSDDLVHAEKVFVETLEKGEIRVDSASRYPYAEFNAFLRTLPKGFKAPAGLRGDPAGIVSLVTGVVLVEDENAEPGDDGTRPRRETKSLDLWMRRLPSAFVAIGARRRENLDRWAAGLIEDRRSPADPVVDYGMFLQAIRLTPEFQASAQLSLLDASADEA